MADIKPLIEGSMEGAERVSDIVKNLRQFSTPQELKNHSLNLTEVIEKATTWVLNATSLKVDVHFDFSDIPALMNKEIYIHQILINLIQNAVDAMQGTKCPKLKISVTTHKENIEILIHDNGTGINDDNLHKLFDPFFTTKDVGSGTGLGLSISLGLAKDQCQGNLLASNHHDGGAQFTLSLPISDLA